jgi:hypothetical protein
LMTKFCWNTPAAPSAPLKSTCGRNFSHKSPSTRRITQCSLPVRSGFRSAASPTPSGVRSRTVGWYAARVASPCAGRYPGGKDVPITNNLGRSDASTIYLVVKLDAFYDVWLLNLAKPRNRDQWLILYQLPEYFAVLFVVIIRLIRIE